jgi:membrane-bound metal-dependent hydrolase YbcI (DUF457 family)
MLAAGHLALGLLAGLVVSKLLKRPLHLPLLLLLVVLPDLDYLLPGIAHRGPTHSMVVQGLFALPFLYRYRWDAVSYLVAVWSHGFSDLFNVAGVQYFWPLSMYNHPIIPYTLVRRLDHHLITAEVLLAGLAVLVLLGTHLRRSLLTVNKWTLLLLGPLGALGASLRMSTLSRILVIPQLLLIGVLAIPLLLLVFPWHARVLGDR